MEEKRHNMGRFEILKTKYISKAVTNFVEAPDKNKMLSFDSIKEQHKSITVCSLESELDNAFIVVDGNKHFMSLKKQGLKKILVYNLGRITKQEYLLKRLLLNVNQERLAYLGIAEAITSLSNQGVRATTISNLTGIPLEDVERYEKLLDFDWDEFNKKQFNQQINPFEDER